MWPKFQTTAVLFLGICIFRMLNTFLIQSFFDPDEYWQTLEPAYCEIFLKTEDQDEASPSSLNLNCAGYTWEWKRRKVIDTASTARASSWLEHAMEGPIRSYLSVLPTHLFYSILAKFHWDSHFLVSQGPKLLTAVIAAAPTEFYPCGSWLIGCQKRVHIRMVYLGFVYSAVWHPGFMDMRCGCELLATLWRPCC